jgi:hypothetical protein
LLFGKAFERWYDTGYSGILRRVRKPFLPVSIL